MKGRPDVNRRELASVLLVGTALWLFLVGARYIVSSWGPIPASVNGSGRSDPIASLLALLVACIVVAAALLLIFRRHKPTTRMGALKIGGLLALAPLAVTFTRLDSGVSLASIRSALAIVGAIGASLLMREFTIAGTSRDSQGLR